MKDKISVVSARTLDDRCAVAGTCLTKLKIEIPALIDNLSNATEVAYTGWPDRLYVIGQDGRVVYKSKPGPYGFKPAEVEATLKRVLPASGDAGQSAQREGIPAVAHLQTGP